MTTPNQQTSPRKPINAYLRFRRHMKETFQIKNQPQLQNLWKVLPEEAKRKYHEEYLSEYKEYALKPGVASPRKRKTVWVHRRDENGKVTKLWEYTGDTKFRCIAPDLSKLECNVPRLVPTSLPDPTEFGDPIQASTSSATSHLFPLTGPGFQPSGTDLDDIYLPIFPLDNLFMGN